MENYQEEVSEEVEDFSKEVPEIESKINSGLRKAGDPYSSLVDMTLSLPKYSNVRRQIFDTENETICPEIWGTSILTSEPPKTIWYDLESIRKLAYVDMNFGFLRAKSYLLNISSSPPCLLSDKPHKTNTESDHTSTQNAKCTTVFHRKGRCALGFDLACLEAEEVDLFSLSTFLVWRNSFRGGASKPYPNRKITCGKQTRRIGICLLWETWNT